MLHKLPNTIYKHADGNAVSEVHPLLVLVRHPVALHEKSKHTPTFTHSVVTVHLDEEAGYFQQKVSTTTTRHTAHKHRPQKHTAAVLAADPPASQGNKEKEQNIQQLVFAGGHPPNY
jgi:hypothetical protein